MSTESNTLPEGYKVHWYEIKQILGQGGFGITYLAHDNNLDTEVAIKEFMPAEIAKRGEGYTIESIDDSATDKLNWGLERFIREARTLTKFNHPNIVRVHTVFEENSTAYMVMSYEKGQSLQERLKQGDTPDEEELLDIVLPLLDGLEVMHNAGFIHRDIKPGNIFIREDGTPLLLDFGSAREAITDETKTLTKVVTPGYAPFEQYYGKSDIQGPWTDIYSLGATLYRCIKGEPPIDATFRNRKTGQDAIQEMWEQLNEYSDDYSVVFLRAIEHSLRAKYKDRPQSIPDWRAMFTDPSISTDTQWLLAVQSAGHSEHDKKPVDNKQKKLNFILMVVLLVLVVVLVAINFI